MDNAEVKSNPNTEVVTVYFSGTAAKKNDVNLLGVLYRLSLRSAQRGNVIAFDGCAITHGWCGGLFGTGLVDQCQEVIETLQQKKALKTKIILNCCGFSRGAIAALLLTNMLKDWSADDLEINLILIDPVSGNYATTVSLDCGKFTLANQSMDVSASPHLKRVLCFYANVALSDWRAHKPVMVKYPKNCAVECHVLPGGHIELVRCGFIKEDQTYTVSLYATVPFVRSIGFLKEVGTTLATVGNFDKLKIKCVYVEFSSDTLYSCQYQHSWNQWMRYAYQELLGPDNAGWRVAGVKRTHAVERIDIITEPASAEQFVNAHHYQLEQEKISNEKILLHLVVTQHDRGVDKSISDEKKSFKDLRGALFCFIQQLYQSLSVESRKTKKGELIAALLGHVFTVNTEDEMRKIFKILLKVALHYPMHTSFASHPK